MLSVTNNLWRVIMWVNRKDCRKEGLKQRFEAYDLLDGVRYLKPDSDKDFLGSVSAIDTTRGLIELTSVENNEKLNVPAELCRILLIRGEIPV